MRAVLKRTMHQHERCQRGNHTIFLAGHTWYKLVYECRRCKYFKYQPCDCNDCENRMWDYEISSLEQRLGKVTI